MPAWITLFTQPSYLPGVRTLRKSLENTRTRYPLVVMVTENIDEHSRRLLTDEGCLVRQVKPVAPRSGVPGNYANPRFSEVWTKLAAWRITEFGRLAFVDADMLAMKNIDEVFDFPLPDGHIAACHACRCNPHRIATYPRDWVPANCYYSYLPEHNGAPLPRRFSPYFNSGFMLLTPNDSTATELENKVAAIRDLAAYQFPEQDLLNEYFTGRWLPLPYIYNALKTLSVQHASLWNIFEVKNLHYILSKPWQDNNGKDDNNPYNELHQLWWKTYRQIG
jgi:alpha-N-acetylglucosamine transferase